NLPPPRVGGVTPALVAPTSRPAPLRGLLPYVALARPDHWFKNVFVVLGVLLACFYQPRILESNALGPILWALATSCCLVSCNYVLNEILDAPTDRNHPTKRYRP